MSSTMETMERPMQRPGTITLHEKRLVALWERVVTRLGIHTVRVLLQRAIWQTAQRHPNIALIHHNDSGLRRAGRARHARGGGAGAAPGRR